MTLTLKDAFSNAPKTATQQQGMTLIELMIATALSLILLAGVLQIFIGNKQTYNVQNAMARLQENGRFALHFLARDIRMADFWGCSGSFPNVNDHLNPGGSNPFDLSAGGIIGSDNDGANGSDILTLYGGTSEGIGIVSHNVNAASFSLTTVNHGLEDFDYIIAADCENADVFQVTNANSGSTTTVVGNTGAAAQGPGNANSPNVQFSAAGGGRIYRFQGITYSLETNADDEPSLVRSVDGADGQRVVDGVENMQILYGIDTNGDNAANFYTSAIAGTNFAQAVSINITLTIRSIEDNVATTSNDNGDYRLRRTFTATTTIRNRVS